MISLIIPTYRRKKLLRRCLNSVYGQKLISEVIIVDDANSKLIKRYVEWKAKSFPISLKYIATKNPVGGAQARNIGVNVASSRFISFLDDDDYILPNRFEIFLPLLLENKYSFYSSGRLTDINYGERVFVTPSQIYGEIKFESLVPRNHIDIGIICSKDKFLAVSGFSQSYNCFQDWNLVLKLVSLYGSGFKIKTHSYVVNEDVNLKRITNQSNRAIGYKSIIGDFGGNLNITQKILLFYEANSINRSINTLDFFSVIACLFTLSLRPVKGTIKKILND